jgi:hypothetical protein
MTPKRKRATIQLRIVALKGGPRHPPIPLPLLPSGPGGVHSVSVTRDHKTGHASWSGPSIDRVVDQRSGSPAIRTLWQSSVTSAYDPRSSEEDPCGAGGIRTLGTFQHTRFPIVHLRPLGHRSKKEVGEPRSRRAASNWRTGRDLNPRCFRTSDFESDTIGHSDTCPKTQPLYVGPRRSSAKNCERTAAHSSARTPPTTSIR